MIRPARLLVAGKAEGPALVLAEPLSFWGGVAPDSGVIVDRSHPDRGRSVAGRVVVMPGGRGSSSSSSVLAELLRRGCGPAALLLSRPDPILTVGCLVAQTLYGLTCPLAVGATGGIEDGQWLRIVTKADGAAMILIGSSPHS